MLFNSTQFLLFFPVVCLLYYCIPARHRRSRNVLLLVASYYFYMSWEPTYVLLLLTSTFTTYIAALGIEHSRTKRAKKRWLFASILSNLCILFLFKYFNFIGSNINDIFRASGLALTIPRFDLLLPVGISFYTFQALGYSIDVYRGTTKTEHDFLTYALFVSFFPQLVAGPIERSNHLLPQFRQQHHFDYDQAMTGLKYMVWGYFLKLVLADRCAIYADAVFNNVSHHNGSSFALASLLFTFQIYGDFAGYSLIAIGTARLLGFHLMNNFRCPYFSCSVGEFWHRWHISLSTWFKDYVYIPFGGNRVGKARNYTNLLITFLLSGIWHGANWTFIFWGALHGVLLCIEKFFGIQHQYIGFRKIVHCGATFVILCITWMIFRANSLADIMTICTRTIDVWGTPFVQDVGWGVLLTSFMAIAMVIGKELTEEYCWSTVNRLKAKPIFQYIGIALLLAVISLFGVFGDNQFIYFQF